MLDPKSVEHADHVLSSVPSLAGNPAVGREQPYRVAAPINRERSKVTDFVATTALQRCRLGRRRRVRHSEFRPDHWRNTRRHALGPQKQVEVTMLDGVAISR